MKQKYAKHESNETMYLIDWIVEKPDVKKNVKIVISISDKSIANYNAKAKIIMGRIGLIGKVVNKVGIWNSKQLSWNLQQTFIYKCSYVRLKNTIMHKVLSFNLKFT